MNIDLHHIFCHLNTHNNTRIIKLKILGHITYFVAHPCLRRIIASGKMSSQSCMNHVETEQSILDEKSIAAAVYDMSDMKLTTDVLLSDNTINPIYLPILYQYQPPSTSHNMEHVRRVVVWATEICNSLEEEESIHLDRQLVQLGALLHDIKDRKYMPQNPAEKELQVKAINRAIKKLADSIGFKQIDRLHLLIDNVSFNKQTTQPEEWDKGIAETWKCFPELCVVRDADRIEALGGIGNVRVISFGAEHERPIETTIQHYDDKLLHLFPKYFYTRRAKLAAEPRHKFLKLSYEIMKSELHEINTIGNLARVQRP